MATIHNVWEEGALTFSFPAGSIASKYDDWAHYRNPYQPTCGGSKAVDLVYATPQIAWLIEVKDFRLHPRTKIIDLPDEIAIKVRDTLAGLVSARCLANNPDEKRCARALLSAKKIRVVCHLEQPAKHSRLHPHVIEPSNLVLKLRTLLKAIDPHPAVVDRRSLRQDMAWIVA
jgi:hypothetical protein